MNNQEAEDIYQATLMAISNLMSTDCGPYIQQALDERVLETLQVVIHTGSLSQMKEALWALGNIVA